ncbi:type II toxin-antitoxin system PemK/MazF family toxin [Weissella soli]|uniref:type II toxin-antitoxin system PemK/MazF family toxin n=1 Tax=Weissella soli TaxID=155866 RepID=UPI003EFAC58A
MDNKTKISRGDIFFADLSPVIGSEQGGQRPVVIVQNDVGNTHSPTTIVMPITAKLTKPKLPTHIGLPAEYEETGIQRDSVILAEQMRTIDKSRLRQKVAQLNRPTMQRIENAVAVSIGLT